MQSAVVTPNATETRKHQSHSANWPKTSVKALGRKEEHFMEANKKDINRTVQSDAVSVLLFK